MWFANEQKVLRELSDLLANLDTIGKRLDKWEEDLKFSTSLGLPQTELISSIQQMSHARNGAYIELSEARLGILMSAKDWKMAIPLMRPGQRVVRVMRRYLDNMDAGAAAGRAKFKNQFGSTDAAHQ